MDVAATRRSSDRSAAAGPLSTWSKLTVAALVTVAILYLFLETVVRGQTKDPVEPTVLALLVGDLVVAGLLLRRRRRWLPLAAAALLLVGLVGAIPHDLPAIVQPDDIAHFVFSVLLLGLSVVGMVSGIQSFRTAPRRP